MFGSWSRYGVGSGRCGGLSVMWEYTGIDSGCISPCAGGGDGGGAMVVSTLT